MVTLAPLLYHRRDVEAFLGPNGTGMTVWKVKLKDWRPERDPKGRSEHDSQGCPQGRLAYFYRQRNRSPVKSLGQQPLLSTCCYIIQPLAYF